MDVENEILAIKKLCNRAHQNIVEVFQIGKLPRDSSYVVIDMELCATNLDSYNKASWALTQVDSTPPGFMTIQIWDIMRQIGQGVDFIHENHLVHRDLKPANGQLPI